MFATLGIIFSKDCNTTGFLVYKIAEAEVAASQPAAVAAAAAVVSQSPCKHNFHSTHLLCLLQLMAVITIAIATK